MKTDSAIAVSGFPPLVAAGARALVLGSIPSVASLEKQQYYGKPQNAFWRIMGALFDAGPELPYAERVARLTASRVAVWDVISACVRPGSLDSSIDMASVVVNDFTALLRDYPSIATVCFNGRKAEQVFRRRVLPDLDNAGHELRFISLPSTSPAMATLNFENKLAQWRVLAELTEEPT